MNPQMIRNLLLRVATAVVSLVTGGEALALPNYVTITNNYCTSIGRPRTTPISCDGCHAANRAQRVDPQWTWYQTPPAGTSSAMANFCPPAQANLAPNGTIASPAGNVTVAQGSTVAFQGSGTDPDNNLPLTYSWNFGGGAPNSTQQNPSVVFATAGTFTVSLTVTDVRGLADPTPATRTVTVTPSSTGNQPPNGTIAQPASDVVINVGQSVSFNGSGTDPDNNTPLTHAWNFGGGAANSTQQNPTVTFATAGTFTVSFTVSDSRGLADPTPATRVVTVMAPNNQPPTASITNPPSDISILKGASVSFRGVGSDPDGNTPLSYRWNFGGGGLPDSTQQNPTIRFDNVGTYSVTLTVTDSLGASTVAPPVRIVTVREPRPSGCRDNDKDGFSPDGGVCGPVDCNDSNAAINPGVAERCGDGIDNDCNGKIDAADPACNGTDCLAAPTQRPPVIIDRARWDAEDRELKVEGSKAPSGTAANLFNAATGALIASVAVERDGEWEFEIKGLTSVPCRVRVDIAGQSAEAAVSGAPSNCGGGTPPPAPPTGNLAPDGRITAPADGARIRRGRTIQFTASGSDPDGNLPLSYAWDFGGGAPASTQPNPSVSFRTAGNYVVRMTVRDAKGLADPTPAQITVRVVNDN